jgi:hypothetical protein
MLPVKFHAPHFPNGNPDVCVVSVRCTTEHTTPCTMNSQRRRQRCWRKSLAGSLSVSLGLLLRAPSPLLLFTPQPTVWPKYICTDSIYSTASRPGVIIFSTNVVKCTLPQPCARQSDLKPLGPLGRSGGWQVRRPTGGFLKVNLSVTFDPHGQCRSWFSRLFIRDNSCAPAARQHFIVHISAMSPCTEFKENNAES